MPPATTLAAPRLAKPSAAILEMRNRALALLTPPARLKLSEWIEKTVRYPSTVSALPGPVRLWPQQRAMADAIGGDIERVTVLKGVRVGFSSLLTAAIGNWAANDPTQVLLVLPTEKLCRSFVTSDLEPTFEATPELAKLLSSDVKESKRNTMLSRHFPSGGLRVIPSRSPGNLRAVTARVILVDEADAMLQTVEGNPIKLAEKRSFSYANRKIVIGGTPTFEATSAVARSYALSDQRVFEVPCPACGNMAEIEFEDLVWPAGEPEKVTFLCRACDKNIPESQKGWMIENGAWRATQPEVVGHAGFRISCLVSPLVQAAWPKLATEYLEAKSDPNDLRVFVNTILARPWVETNDDIDQHELKKRAEPFSLDAIPREVLSITAGVDCQDDRLEITFLGWTANDECLVLAHVVRYGPTMGDDGVWQELDDLLKAQWPHPLGGQIRVDACCIDAGSGSHFETVLNFTSARYARRVVGIKGVPGLYQPDIKKSATTRAGGKGVLWLVGVDSLKTSIFARLARGRTIRFSDTLDAEYYNQLTSERRVVRYQRGKPVGRFERIKGKRAESLDAMVYAHAAHTLAPLNVEAREGQLSLKPIAALNPVTKSSWVANRGGRF